MRFLLFIILSLSITTASFSKADCRPTDTKFRAKYDELYARINTHIVPNVSWDFPFTQNNHIASPVRTLFESYSIRSIESYIATLHYNPPVAWKTGRIPNFEENEFRNFLNALSVQERARVESMLRTYAFLAASAFSGRRLEDNNGLTRGISCAQIGPQCPFKRLPIRNARTSTSVVAFDSILHDLRCLDDGQHTQASIVENAKKLQVEILYSEIIDYAIFFVPMFDKQIADPSTAVNNLFFAYKLGTQWLPLLMTSPHTGRSADGTGPTLFARFLFGKSKALATTAWAHCIFPGKDCHESDAAHSSSAGLPWYSGLIGATLQQSYGWAAVWETHGQAGCVGDLSLYSSQVEPSGALPMSLMILLAKTCTSLGGCNVQNPTEAAFVSENPMDGFLMYGYPLVIGPRPLARYIELFPQNTLKDDLVVDWFLKGQLQARDSAKFPWWFANSVHEEQVSLLTSPGTPMWALYMYVQQATENALRGFADGTLIYPQNMTRTQKEQTEYYPFLLT